MSGKTRPTRRFQLRVPAEDRHLAEIRDFIQEVGEKIQIPGKILANTKLAVDEACTNVVKHGYKGRTGYLEVVVTGNQKEFSIEIQDQGESFDLRNVKSPDLKMYVETRKRGGLGVFLMNQLMDEVRYRGSPEGNVLSMSKRLGRRRRRVGGRGAKPRSLRVTYTLQAFGAMTFLVAVAFTGIHARQIQSVREETRSRARSVARSLALPASGLLSRPEPMSIEQTLLNQSIRAAVKANPEYVSVRVLDTTGRVWGSDRFEELFTTQRGLRGTVTEPVRAGATGTPGAILGYVVLSVSEQAVEGRILAARAELAGIALLTLFLGCGLSVILIGVFVRPIQVLSDNVRAIGEGSMVAEVGVSGNEEIDEIARAFNEITAKFRAAQGNLVEQERLQKEMQVAQEIQQSLLPRNVPELEGYEIGALYRAAKEVGGDYYDFLHVDERTIGVVVADVSGKGVPGSLVMTMIRTALRMEARGNRSASDVMARMNTFVTEDMKKGMFVTMFYVVLDSVNRIVTYASAGHNPMILYRGESDATYFLKPKGIPVGIDAPDADLFRRTISVERLTLQQDDMLVIYTDGITEAMNPGRDQFGEPRLLAAIKKYGHLTAQEFTEALDREIHEFTSGAAQNDDITLVAIKEKVQPEVRLESARRELFRLIEEEKVPVAEACERLQVAPSTYYRYRRRVAEVGGEEGLKSIRPRTGMQKASLEEEAVILALVKAEPLLGAKKMGDLLRATGQAGPGLTEAMIYVTLRRNGLNTREKRLEFAQNGTDRRMARLARALSETARPDRAPDLTGEEPGGGT
ncbi:MAG TPA: SpoIIE family protein phosphatase [Candidatus Dormibacteraeota bacterium]|nr:SpoIIE family protein phosphatase [Candidatus Dormibacteraeota bacterium]